MKWTEWTLINNQYYWTKEGYLVKGGVNNG